tara:strand:- start:358 stop:639 length:282 start_codon:yes stop_codon:yes gene_type:complete
MWTSYKHASTDLSCRFESCFTHYEYKIKKVQSSKRRTGLADIGMSGLIICLDTLIEGREYIQDVNFPQHFRDEDGDCRDIRRLLTNKTIEEIL